MSINFTSTYSLAEINFTVLCLQHWLQLVTAERKKEEKKSINITYLLSPPLASSLITLILEHFPTESFWISLNSLNSFSDYGIVGLFCCGLILLTVNIKHLTDLNNTLLSAVKTFVGLLYTKIINTKQGFGIQTRNVGIYGLINSVRSLQ